jgi:hypothetical protein
VKGKQAALAKNRLAALDNEILAETVAERDALAEQVAQLNRTLYEVRRDQNSKMLQSAKQMSERDVAAARAHIVAASKENDDARRRMARTAFKLLLPHLRNFSSDATQLMLCELADTFEMGDELGELLAYDGKDSGLRIARRRTSKSVRGAINEYAQHADSVSLGATVGLRG